MSDSTAISSPDVAALSTEGSSEPPVTAVPPATTVRASSVQASACGCKGGAGQLVYALGQIGYDLISEARLDSLTQKMAGGVRAGTTPDRTLPFNPSKLHAYLEKNPWDSAAVEWTLSVDDTPIYAIRPQGPYAADAYKELRAFLKQRYEEGVERVSIPGVMSGSATLLLGQTVPVIVPELRGMYSWTTKALVDAVAGPEPARRAPARARESHKHKSDGVYNFLLRVYHELRNLGVLPQDRAINFSATNAFEIEKIYEQAIHEKMELDTINVSRSPICRPGSDCWDVEVFFFFPEHPQQTVRKVYRFTVDVSDTVPVTVGSMRSWFTR